MTTHSAIHRLNIIEPALSELNDTQEADQAELDAQLSMWTNLNFGSEDSQPFFNAERDTASRSRHKNRDSHDMASRSSSKDRSIATKAPTITAAQGPNAADILFNADTLAGLNLNFFGTVGAAALQAQQMQHLEQHQSQQLQNNAQVAAALQAARAAAALGLFPSAFAPPPSPSAAHQQANTFDSLSFLASLGLDPFTAQNMVPNMNWANPLNPMNASLAPLTVRDPNHNGSESDEPPSTIEPSASVKSSEHAGAPPAPKRLRTSRKYPASLASSEGPEDMTEPFSPIEPSTPNLTTPLTPAEDKRRRNTAASARFRLKKKEREAAMENKAKILEDKVGELERECESLRKENGWLKGLVVGVSNGEVVPMHGPTSGIAATVGSDNTEDLLRSVAKISTIATDMPPPTETTKTGTNKRKRTTAD